MPPVILLVEDDHHDVFMVRSVFQAAAPDAVVVAVHDGDAAQAYLGGESPYDDRTTHPFPDLVLLDLKLPRTTGHEVLAWMREQRELQDLPVFILSSSANPDDIEMAYRAGANGYLRKEGSVAALEDIVRGIVAFLGARQDPEGTAPGSGP